MVRRQGLAPAKINLFLAILGRRPDGFHELDTVMAGLGLADRLTLEVAPSGQPEFDLQVHGPQASADIPTDASNLAMAALIAGARRARELGAEPHGPLRLQLEKFIPSRAGLGGGSSDAATVLHLLESLLKIDLGAVWRRDWLASVGSDTVFFDAARPDLHGRCQGRGERVLALPALPPAWRVALVTPALEAATGSVFRALGKLPLVPLADPPPFTGVSLETARESLRNDLQAAALSAVPQLARVAERLAPLPVPFMLTGSGSSFFALCADDAEASELSQAASEALGDPRLVWSGPLASPGESPFPGV